MIGGISGGMIPYSYYNFQYKGFTRKVSEEPALQTQAAGRTMYAAVSTRPAQPDTPVQPVDPVSMIHADEGSGVSDVIPFLRIGADPAELAVKMRMTSYEPDQEAGQTEAAAGAEGTQKVLEESECQTCAERKYQDGSDDPGVSFKAATHIDREDAPQAVRGHEMEHVVREQAKAEQEDRQVVSQHVKLHTSVCPECGKVYVSGGTTTTTTAADPKTQEPGQGMRQPFSAVA